MNFIQSLLQKHKDKLEAVNNLCDQKIAKVNSAISDHDEVLNKPNDFIDLNKAAIYQNKWGELYAFSSSKAETRELRRASSYNAFLQKSVIFCSFYQSLESQIREHNFKISQSLIAEAARLICPVEGRALDQQQLECIVKKSYNHLVLAGAGTGKTTTIIGLIKYLLATNACKYDEILVLSYTNASATEMAGRIMKETGKSIEAFTFHKLGVNIIASVNGYKPNITQVNLRKFVSAKVNELMQDKIYFGLLVNYLLYNRVAAKSEFEFASRSEYDQYLKHNPPITLLNENVKSYAEMDIANYLNSMSVRYLYEPAYQYETSNNEFSQYHPDFYLPDYDIYIEHFGIDRNGNVPSYFESRGGMTATQVYQESMTWKRELHRRNSTRMIECYYYEKSEGVLLSNLGRKLQDSGVRLTPKNPQDLWENIINNNKSVLEGIYELFETVINLIKSNQYDIPTVIDINRRNLQNVQSNETILSLVEPLFDEYSSLLKQSNEIDFNDMINLAARYIHEGHYVHSYQYVIVDEYQDISKSRYGLLTALRQSNRFNLFCVGDDWQSIYRFAGSDIGYIINFQKYWGLSEISRIETTYRFTKSLIDISGQFVMRNPAQIRKAIKSTSGSNAFCLGEIYGYTDRNAVSFMSQNMADLPRNSSVYLIGRYNFDVKMLDECEAFRYRYDNANNDVVVNLNTRADLKIHFITVHKSKGLQADYVYILNNKKNGMGFPSKIQDAPILQLLLDNSDMYQHAEERRLFYVALTRAKKKVWIITIKDNESLFVDELKLQYNQEIKAEKYTCPTCGGRIIKKTGKNGPFWGCSNYHNNGCRYTRDYC